MALAHINKQEKDYWIVLHPELSWETLANSFCLSKKEIGKELFV